jgi:sporulation protein YlmC with PRC-barrel domain
MLRQEARRIMSAMRLELGRRVRCTDQTVGELADVVIDPVKRRLTHIVVKPHYGQGQARLVPIELVEPGDDELTISLRCTAAEVRELPTVEEFAYLRVDELAVEDPDWDVGVTRVLALPYYEGGDFDGYLGEASEEVALAYDRVPKGEVEVRRSSSVVTSDGRYVGDVDGFLVDEDDQITHFVLERGHLWGRREVTVPIGAVEKLESDTVVVGLTTRELGDLPARHVHRWPWQHHDGE